MKIKYLLLSALSGLLLAFSHPNFIENGLKTHTFFFIWFAYTPLIYILMKETSKKAVFFYTAAAGTVFYLVGLYWLCYVEPMGAGAYVCWVLLALYLSLYMGAAFVAARVLKDRFRIDYLLSLPAAFTILEYCREWVITGFQVLTPAQSQLQFLPMLQMLKITGLYGPAFLILFINTLIVTFALEKRINMKNAAGLAGICVAVLLAVFAVMSNFSRAGGEKIKAAIIQPDIDQNTEWSNDYRLWNMNTYKRMIQSVSAEKPGIVVWPETGYPGILNTDPARGAEIALWAPGAYNMVGSDSYERKNGETSYYNSAFLLNEKGEITGSYSKFHLVPFGEYVPLQHTVKFIKKVVQRYGYTGFTPGKKIEPLNYRGIKFGALICYDSLFPEISREFARKGARFLTHLSYETWYFLSPASAQIFLNTALRAIENNMPVIRCVASGMSGFIDAKGRIYSSTPLFEEKTSVAEIETNKNGQMTLYTRFGDWFPYFLLLVLIALAAMNKVKKNDSPHN